MRIAICDDQEYISEELSVRIKKFNEEHHLENDLLYFSTPSKLYAYMEQERLDVIFMDLEFCNTNEDGIAWSKQIINRHPGTIIIILTAYPGRYKEGYVARAFRFMTKPIEGGELFENLQACMEELQLTKTIPLYRRGVLQNVRMQDVGYLSAQSGGTEIWTRTDMYYSEDSLLQWEKKLPSILFFRCHKKYLVNLTHVIDYENHVITLIHGEKLPVSRRKWKAFQIAYMKCDTHTHIV